MYAALIAETKHGENKQIASKYSVINPTIYQQSKAVTWLQQKAFSKFGLFAVINTALYLQLHSSSLV